MSPIESEFAAHHLSRSFDFSILDSRRHELRVFRASGYELGPDLARELVRSDSDIVIVRVPSGRTDSRSVSSLSAFEPIHADTLVYYELNAELAIQRSNSTSQVVIGLVRRADVTEVGEVAAEAFANYSSHYASNELFDKGRTLSGYVEWAEGLATDSRALVLVAREYSTVVGFIALEVRGQIAEIVLNAVTPSSQGRGVYGALLDAAVSHASRLQVAKIVVSTQVQNSRVQRAWIRAGFTFAHAMDTFHLSPLLGSRIDVHDAEMFEGMASVGVLRKKLRAAIERTTPVPSGDVAFNFVRLMPALSTRHVRVSTGVSTTPSGLCATATVWDDVEEPTAVATMRVRSFDQ